MKYFILLFLIILTISPASAKRIYAEKVYQEQWCKAHRGIIEYKLDDGTRVDCLTDDRAIEFDFANKWAECIGQSLYYGLRTGKTPTCGLIMENGDKDVKYLKRLRRVAYKKGIKTFTIKPEQINLTSF